MQDLKISIEGSEDKVLEVYNKLYDKEFESVDQIKGHLYDVTVLQNFLPHKEPMCIVMIKHRLY